MRLRYVLVRTFKVVGLMLSGVVLTGLFVYIQGMRARPALQPWHVTSLDEEYRAGDPDVDFYFYPRSFDRGAGGLHCGLLV